MTGEPSPRRAGVQLILYDCSTPGLFDVEMMEDMLDTDRANSSFYFSARNV